MNRSRVVGHFLVAASLLSVAGCRVRVDKGKNGDEKDVKIATPLGGIHVTKDTTNAADLGLPAYPEATLASDKQGDKSANVNMGFGPWQLHVKVVSYETADPQEKVLEFYRKALGTYGEVIECDGGRAVGTPVRTNEGLTCQDSDSHSHGNVKFDDDGTLQLKAGSQHNQHIVAFKNRSDGSTRFTLIAVELPRDFDGGKQESN